MFTTIITYTYAFYSHNNLDLSLQLFKTHMDYMERTKILMGGDRIMDSATTPAGK